MKQIAETLSSTPYTVRNYMYRIVAETGYVIPYLRMSWVQESGATVEPPKLPPSYRPKKDTVPHKCAVPAAIPTAQAAAARCAGLTVGSGCLWKRIRRLMHE